jgi:3-oxoacyl-[acyl-carrier-protein] synthase II
MTPEDIVACINGPLPEKLPILTGQKGNLGHAVAAAGAIESVFTIKCIHEQKLPFVKNLTEPLDPELSYAMENMDVKLDVVVKNGFVFGGVNCSILFKSV